jgi:hypothetical protein
MFVHRRHVLQSDADVELEAEGLMMALWVTKHFYERGEQIVKVMQILSSPRLVFT